MINRLQDHGGAEVSTLAILEGLQGQEFQFRAVTLFGEADFAGKDRLVERGVEFAAAPVGFWRRLRFLDRQVVSWRPDVLHSALFEADLVTRIVGPLRRVPVLSSLVNTEFSREAQRSARSPWRLRAVRLLNIVTGRLGVSHFHAISQTTADHGRLRLRIPSARIAIVSRGRDATRLGRRSEERRQFVRASLDMAESTFVILNVARREPQKGQLYLIDAFRLVKVEQPDSQLLIAGREGTVSEALRNRVSEFGLDDSVHFLGMRRDVADLLCACDVFVLSSLWEGLGGVLIEALALEAPIVAFKIDAATEVVGPCGTFVGVGDVPALAAEMLNVQRSPILARQQASTGRDRFESRYSFESMKLGMAQLYVKVADLPAPPCGLRRSPRQ